MRADIALREAAHEDAEVGADPDAVEPKQSLDSRLGGNDGFTA